MARISTQQANLRGPIQRDEDLIAHPWFITLAVGASIGAIALLLWMFQAGAWSERRWPSSGGRPASTSQVWTPVQPAQPTRVPSAPSRELTPEEKGEKLKQELRRQYGVQ